jgi:large subunit ribosomal protein L13
MKTKFFTREEVKKNWYIIDAKDQILGRLAAKVAKILMGKHKPQYTPNADVGDFVIVTNASFIKLTGKKLIQKFDFRHSGYPDGDKLTPYKVMVEKYPERTIKLAVLGMLPKNKLRKRMIKRLKIFKDNNHKFGIYNPIPL